MPEQRLQRTREAYEPTDRPFPNWLQSYVTEQYRERGWRPMHENAAEQLKRLGLTANVIEGEQH